MIRRKDELTSVESDHKPTRGGPLALGLKVDPVVPTCGRVHVLEEPRDSLPHPVRTRPGHKLVMPLDVCLDQRSLNVLRSSCHRALDTRDTEK